MGRVDQVIGRAASSVSDVDAVVARAAGTVRGADEAVARALVTLAVAGGLVGDAEGLLARVTGPVDLLLPVVRRLSESFNAQEVDALVLLLERLPGLLALVDDDVVPLLRALSDVAPDLHNVLEIVDDLHRLVSGLLGVKRLRKRGGWRTAPGRRPAGTSSPDSRRP